MLLRCSQLPSDSHSLSIICGFPPAFDFLSYLKLPITKRRHLINGLLFCFPGLFYTHLCFLGFLMLLNASVPNFHKLSIPIPSLLCTPHSKRRHFSLARVSLLSPTAAKVVDDSFSDGGWSSWLANTNLPLNESQRNLVFFWDSNHDDFLMRE